MQIIPVIDIKAGVAVHARRGDRAGYQPLTSRFAGAPEVGALTASLLDALPVEQIYFADLDALAGKDANTALILGLVAAYPSVRFMLDAGFSSRKPPTPFLQAENVDLVMATEALSGISDYEYLRATIPPARQVLSLDRRDAAHMGCESLFADASLWPQRVINMNLARVGADGGPDLEGIRALRARNEQVAILAAGGVRGIEDLRALADEGVSGVLLATALHDGRLDATALDATKFQDTSCDHAEVG